MRNDPSRGEDERSDVELVCNLSSAQAGEREAAFTVLFERHRDRAFQVAYRVLGDAALAADAVQEAFLAVYHKAARFQGRARFTSWLHRVVVNQSIDLRRRERRHRHAPLEAPEGSPPGSGPPPGGSAAAPADGGPEAGAVRTERAERVRDAIAALSPKLAEVVVLRYPQGLSYEEIGKLLELPPGTVRSRLNRAHAALRRLLEDSLEEDG